MPAVAAIAAVSIALAFGAPPDISLERGSNPNAVAPSVLNEGDPFRQLDETLPTPSETRTASGAPGPRYWQQKADFDIEVTLDPKAAELIGHQRVRYHNNSPDELRYLWMQLDQNRFTDNALGERANPAPDLSRPQGIGFMRSIVENREWEGGYRDVLVTSSGATLHTVVVDTMMRIDLPAPLGSGGTFEFDVSWRFKVVKSTVARARSCYEILGEGDPDVKDGDKVKDLAPIYDMAQFYPRMAPYSDVRGWQHKQFLGQGEFALDFGDFTLAVTVPDNWTVGASGELQNEGDVLSAEQRERLSAARNDEKPRFVITPEEAAARRAATPTGTKTWKFVAKNVRDVAFGASPTFIWDAAKAPIPGTDRAALAMSFYPVEAEPLWSRFSTHAVAHTIDSYSRHAYPYPYPVAISVNGPVGGMEYPMISFNGPRPEKDGTYSQGTKLGLIGVVIHEVGHNWFPMIVNSDERQWTWMDEGLNTFCQYLAEQEWEHKYPSGRGEPEKIIEYMTSADQEPIMTNSESAWVPTRMRSPRRRSISCAKPCSGASCSTTPFSSIAGAGRSSALSPPTSSAPWRTHRALISIGSGAVGSTQRDRSTSPSRRSRATPLSRSTPSHRRARRRSSAMGAPRRSANNATPNSQCASTAFPSWSISTRPSMNSR